MKTDITIPPAALEAGAAIIEKYRISGWTDAMVARAAFLAIVEAWPGMVEAHHPRENQHALILPLPQEASDDQ